MFFVFAAFSAYATPKDIFVFQDIGDTESLDIHKLYDSAGQGRVINLYETLIGTKGNHPGKYEPLLATSVPTVENGGISKDGKTYTFTIRSGVKFHNGATLTTEDVVYSMKRGMIMDPSGGPMWILLEALTGKSKTRENNTIIPGIFELIDKSVEAKGNRVIFHLPKPFPPLMGILANVNSSIINKKYAIAHGAWDGNIQNAAKYNGPKNGDEPLLNSVNGTGPYKLGKWNKDKETILERFEEYWRPKPQIKHAIFKVVTEWSARKLALQRGDADRVHVGAPEYQQVMKIRNVTVSKLPQLTYVGVMFCQKVNTTANPYVGSGKLDGEGIPTDFLSHIGLRKAFAHAYDHTVLIAEVMNGLGVRPSSPNIIGMPYRINVKIPEFDLAKSEKYLKEAYGGELWKKGFKMTIAYNQGRDERQAVALMIAENIMSLNPKFKIETQPMVWSDYMPALRENRFPIFIIGWGADYPDPHNVIHPFMSKYGTYGEFLNYDNPEVEKQLAIGIGTANPKVRRKAYYRLQKIWEEDFIGLIAFQSTELLVYQKGISGYNINPLYSPAVEVLKNIRK